VAFLISALMPEPRCEGRRMPAGWHAAAVKVEALVTTLLLSSTP
jgi:hypothetical protein